MGYIGCMTLLGLADIQHGPEAGSQPSPGWRGVRKQLHWHAAHFRCRSRRHGCGAPQLRLQSHTRSGGRTRSAGALRRRLMVAQRVCAPSGRTWALRQSLFRTSGPGCRTKKALDSISGALPDRRTGVHFGGKRLSYDVPGSLRDDGPPPASLHLAGGGRGRVGKALAVMGRARV